MKDSIEKVITSIIGDIGAKNASIYNKVIEEHGISYENINSPEDFYYNIIYPLSKFIDGVIQVELSRDEDLKFILKQSRFIECHFVKLIEKNEGSACSADKSRTIMRGLFNFYKDGIDINFNYDQEYTYHLPKTIFNTHDKIVEFYTGLKYLYYGNPDKYLEALLKIKK